MSQVHNVQVQVQVLGGKYKYKYKYSETLRVQVQVQVLAKFTSTSTSTSTEFQVQVRVQVLVLQNKVYSNSSKLLALLMICFIMRPSSLGGGRILRHTLSVRLSVCPSVRPSR